jgi:hypothetical protein
MPACVSTSETGRASRRLLLLVCAVLAAAAIPATPTMAQGLSGGGAGGSAPKEGNKAGSPEEEDLGSTPFTEYGEFNEDTEEAADAKFFQYGRFFGVSLSGGLQTVTGNRGLLWKGGFPNVALKIHYWFDFNLSLELGFETASHSYTDTRTNDFVDANMIRTGGGIRYQFDTRDLAAPISFANPYLTLAMASYAKRETSTLEQTTEPDSNIGFSVGAGFEIALKPKKAYLLLDGRAHFVTFKDTLTTNFRSLGLPDLTGQFYTWTAGVLFTW